MNKVQRIEDAILQVPQIVDGVLSDQLVEALKERVSDFKEKKEKSNWISVPLVGAFSAGKSSLLNFLLGKEGLLPIDSMPETAIPYELYFDTIEHVELYDEEGVKIDDKPLEQIQELDAVPGRKAKVYVNSDMLRHYHDLGIALVDMPGLKSGVDRHEKAITHYIGLNKEAVFVYCVGIQEGNLDITDLAFLRELQAYGQASCVILTKCNLSTPHVVEETTKKISEQLINEAGLKDPVVASVGDVDIKGLSDYLDGLNVDNIRANRLLPYAKAIVGKAIEQLKICCEVRKADVANVNQKILALEEEIEKLNGENPVDSGIGDSPEQSTQDIMDDVMQKLEERVEDLAKLYIDGKSQEEVNQFVVRIVRPAIITSFKEECRQYMDALSSTIDKELVEALIGMEIQPIIIGEDGSVDDIVNEITPIAEILVELLPESMQSLARRILEILPMLTKVFTKVFGVNKGKQLAKACTMLREDAIPGIAEVLRPKVFDIVSKSQIMIQEQVTKAAIEKIEQYKQELLAKASEANHDKSKMEQEILNFEGAIKQLQSLNITI